MAANLGKLIDKSTDDNTRNCKQDPTTCLWQCCVDALVFMVLFSVMSVLIDHRRPNVDSLGTFAAVWIPTLFALKILDLEYSDQLARVAGWSLAQKMFSVMTN
jgi:hypothetical protein